MTFGSGGHTKQLLETGKDIRVLAIDRDPAAYNVAVQMCKQSNNRVVPILAKFSEVPALLSKYGLQRESIDGIIMDLGPSELQLNDPSRGFNHSKTGPLDMRMDGNRIPNSITAFDVLHTLSSEDLTKIFKVYGESRLARKYAAAVVDARLMLKKFTNTTEFANFIDSIAAERLIDEIERTRTSATKIFQGLRIFVNNELNELHYAINKLRPYICLDNNLVQMVSEKESNMKAFDEEIRNSSSGKLAIISTNPLEDTIAKRNFQNIELEHPYSHLFEARFNSHLHLPSESEMSKFIGKTWYSLTKTAVRPTDEQLMLNPNYFPTKLRVATRVR